MNNSNTKLYPLGSLLLGCNNLISKVNVANLTHIFRECSAIADSLAKCNISHELGLVCFDNPLVHAANDGTRKSLWVIILDDTPFINLETTYEVNRGQRENVFALNSCFLKWIK
ncbi:hypothetical protein ACLB2K_047301 [Fragaria x ananassa]